MKYHFSKFWFEVGVSGHNEKPFHCMEGLRDGEKAKEDLTHGSHMFILVHLK